MLPSGISNLDKDCQSRYLEGAVLYICKLLFAMLNILNLRNLIPMIHTEHISGLY